MGDDNTIVDITSTPHLQAQTLMSHLKGLCSKAVQIKADICSSLAKTSFRDVIVKDMIGQGNAKVKKEFLADNVIALVRLVDLIDPFVNGEVSALLEADQLPKTNNNHEQYVNLIQNRLDGFDKTIKSNQDNIKNMFNTLTQLVSSSTSSRSEVVTSCSDNNKLNNSTTPSPGMEPNTASPHISAQPQCDPYVRYVKNAVTETMQNTLKTFVSDHEHQFVNIGGCRDTLYFGEYGYKYNGGQHEAKDIPRVVDSHLLTATIVLQLEFLNHFAIDKSPSVTP